MGAEMSDLTSYCRIEIERATDDPHFAWKITIIKGWPNGSEEETTTAVDCAALRLETASAGFPDGSCLVTTDGTVLRWEDNELKVCVRCGSPLVNSDEENPLCDQHRIESAR